MRAPNAPSCVLLFLSSPSLHAFRAHAISFRSGPGCELQRRWTGSSAASAAPALHSSPSTCRRQHDEESKGVKVTVWWDLENCHVPSGVNVFQVPHRITSALRAHGIRGPVSITAFGDVSRMTHAALDALCTSGVRLNHVPICEKNSSDRSLLVDLVYWVARNPPPLHFFLISSNRAFANILHRLRMNNYNILLASKRGASCALMSSATVMWQWSTLVSGESLTGMHVNHPPDGLYDSWYGHCRGSLDNLLPDPEQATVTQPEESLEPTTDAISRQISEALVEEIRQILHLHPEGISIAELFSELKRSNVALDNDYFLHRKFSHLLLSMPNIFRIKFTPGDSQTLVFAVPHKAMNPIGRNSKSRAGAGVNETVETKEDRNSEDDVKASTLLPSTEESSSHEGDMGGAFRSNEGDQSESDHSTLPDSSYGCAEHVHLDCIANMDNKEKAIAGSAMSHDGARGLKSSSFLNHTFGWLRFWKTGDEDAIASEKAQGCVSKHVNQFVEERGSNRYGLPDTTSHSRIQAEMSSVFSKPHFWDSLQSFLCTSKVSDLISNSRTREELIHGLQKQGPLLLGSLEETHLHQLVNLLIMERKWLREFTSHGCPFELTFPVKGPTHNHDVNSLSSIFTDKTSHSSSKVLSTQDMRQQDWNSFSRTSNAKCPKDNAELRAWFSKFRNGNERISSMDYGKHFERKFGRKLDCVRYGYFTMDNLIAGCTSNSENHPKGNNYPAISRKDIISDCRNLLKDFLEHNPHGFNIGLFAPMFLIGTAMFWIIKSWAT